MALYQSFPVLKGLGLPILSALSSTWQQIKLGDADQQRAILLSVCGPATYRFICNLVSPKKPTELKFQDIVDLVTKHHDPKPSVIVQRYSFNTRNCRSEESISTYAAELRHLSEHCNFGTALNETLREWIVCRIEDQKIQRRLLAEPELTFDKAFELALASESADKNAKDLQPAAKAPQDPVHKLQVRQPLPCYHCGGKQKSGDCCHKAAECHNCGKVGHLAHVCKSKVSLQWGKCHAHRNAQLLALQTCCLKTLMIIQCTTLKDLQPLVVSVKLNSVDLEMELDTRASISVISEAIYNGFWPKGKAPAIQESQVKLNTYSGEQLSVKAVIKVEAQYKDQYEQLQLVVAQGNESSLFGTG